MAREKGKFIQVRVSDNEKVMVKALADDYGLDVSSFFLAVMDHIKDERPTLKIIPAGKESAPTAIMA